MNDAKHVSRPRCLAVWLGVTAGVAAVLWAVFPLEVSLAGSFDDLLVRLCSWALVVCSVWFWGVTTVVVAGALRTAATAEPGVVTGGVRGVPAPVRRLVLLLCGVALSGGVAAPALATPGASHLDGHDHSGRVVLSGLPFPDRATEGGARAQTPQAVPDRVHGSGMQTHAARQVVVRPGDSLWSIAADHLAPTASDAEVATAWHALYTLNRDAIGPDPDRIEPGLRLDLPASLARPSEGASS